MGATVLVETTNTLYEVDLALRNFRVLTQDPETGDRLLGGWQRYDRISPVQPGEPLRIFVALADAGRRQVHYRIVTTDPVTKVLAA